MDLEIRHSSKLESEVSIRQDSAKKYKGEPDLSTSRVISNGKQRNGRHPSTLCLSSAKIISCTERLQVHPSRLFTPSRYHRPCYPGIPATLQHSSSRSLAVSSKSSQRSAVRKSPQIDRPGLPYHNCAKGASYPNRYTGLQSLGTTVIGFSRLAIKQARILNNKSTRHIHLPPSTSPYCQPRFSFLDLCISCILSSSPLFYLSDVCTLHHLSLLDSVLVAPLSSFRLYSLDSSNS